MEHENITKILDGLVGYINRQDENVEELKQIATGLNYILHQTPDDQILSEIFGVRDKNFDENGNYLGYPALNFTV